jgi:parallel beta-helix repeat protein
MAKPVITQVVKSMKTVEGSFTSDNDGKALVYDHANKIFKFGDNLANISQNILQRAINVKAAPYNCKGDGTVDTAAIQSTFNVARDKGAVVLYFPDGDYVLDYYIRLYSNTMVIMSPNARIMRSDTTTYTKVFINGIRGHNDFASGYNGVGNIHFYGGTIDGNVNNPYDSLTFFDLGHGFDISFKHVTFQNGNNSHYLQLSGSKGVRFDSCSFLNDRFTDTSGYTNYEAIQIEAINDDSFPTFGYWDETVTRDIIIENCTFDGVVRAIGTHGYINTQTSTGTGTAGSTSLTVPVADVSRFPVGSSIWIKDGNADGTNMTNTVTAMNTTSGVLTLQDPLGSSVTNTKLSNETDQLIPKVYCENIVIRNNIIKNCKDQAIRLEGYKYVTVENNILDTSASDGLFLYQVLYANVKNNRILNSQKTGLYLNRCNNSIFRDNLIVDSSLKGTGNYSAIRLYTTRNNTFDENTAMNTGMTLYAYAMYFSDGCIGDKILSHRYMKGNSSILGGSNDTEKANYLVGQGQDELFNGDIGTAGTNATLTHDIRNYSMVIIMGNNNSSDTAAMVSMVIPKNEYILGTTGRFRLVCSDTAAADHLEFSFPNGTSIQADTISGLCHIRRVIGIV